MRTSLALALALCAAAVGCGDASSPSDGTPGPQAKTPPADFDVDAAATRDGSGYREVGPSTASTSVDLTAEQGFAGYVVRGFRGQVVTVTLGGARDAFLFAYGPRRDGRWGAPIARADDGEGTTDATLTLTLGETGEYLILATSYPNARDVRPDDRGGLTLTVDAGLQRAPELGSGDHSAGSVTLTSVYDGLRTPTAIAFNPATPSQFWVTSWANDSFTIVDTAGQTPASPMIVRDRSAHFLVYPTSLAFATDGTVATCQESNNDYRGLAQGITPGNGNNFMGPVVDPTDLDMIRRTPTNTHYDMLHHSPWCMGIANTEPRVFWAFNGQSGSIDKYNFGEWHEPGGDDHADGLTWRFAAGELSRVEHVPSHMAYDAQSGFIYVADTGHSRVVRLDARVETTRDMPRLRGAHTETPLYEVPDSHVEEVIGAAAELQQPSGLVLHNGLLFVSDYATGRVTAFTMAGERVNWLDTGLPAGCLAGIAFGADGQLYAVDKAGGRVLRVDP